MGKTVALSQRTCRTKEHNSQLTEFLVPAWLAPAWLARRQLALEGNSPSLLFDQGTMGIMTSASGIPDKIESKQSLVVPYRSFSASADEALSAAAAFFTAASPPRCKSNKVNVSLEVGSLLETVASAEQYGGFAASAVAIRILRKGSLTGPAALITHFRTERCTVVESSTHPYVQCKSLSIGHRMHG